MNPKIREITARDPAPAMSLPLWILEKKLAEARAEFKRTEEAYRRAEKAVRAAEAAVVRRQRHD